jgi:molecular chaperone DnaK (HSP70)
MPARFAVGIDLGTTNTVVAFAPLSEGTRGPTAIFTVPQLVAPGEVEALALFPSVLYAPLEGEDATDPFGDAPWVTGVHARKRGGDVAGRAVSSSKSWLVHPSVDRAAAILPWGGEEGAPKLSPVDAATRLLGHVRVTWDDAHPDAPLASQDVVLTVPASFDEVARELTLSAATRAGLSPRLLEEPQAAFYDWMGRAGATGLKALLDATGGEARVLIVDVGGGTTDLSLVRVTGVAQVERVAVGPHLLLGGDNMDLALAHALEPRLTDAGSARAEGAHDKLDAPRFGQLVAQCRAAKERLLGDAPPDDAPVTVVAPGARLVGGTRTTRLSRHEAERIVLEGFLPVVAGDARPQRARTALVGFGLPYEREVAITRHVAAFVARHAHEGNGEPGRMPNALLLNGGVFRAARLADRMAEVVSGWGQGGQGAVTRLPDADPDLAVARGAVAYALARRGLGVRIGGGSARGYFVAVGEGRAVCVVPRGAQEGVAYGTEGRTFALATGRPVRFDLFASDEVASHAGEVVDVDDERFARLPPVVTHIDAGPGVPEARVAIEGELSPVGTVDLACATREGQRRFRLAFALRDTDGEARATSPSRASELPAPSRRLEPAWDLVDRAFGKARSDATGREAKDLLRDLEKAMGERSQWTLEQSRALFDRLLPGARSRRRSSDHERVFWLLAGFCLRPGFGDALDAPRVAGLFSLFDERLAFPAEARGWQQFFIAWRRVAAGLDEAAQTKIRDFTDPYLAPSDAGLKKPKKPALSLDDALDMVASLERVAPGRRVTLGAWILERTWTDRDPRLWAALGRLGSRVPAYASAHHVIPPPAAERWLDHMLREKWDAVPTAMAAAVQIARRTGDRARDISDRVRLEIERRLVAVGAPPDALRAVREVAPVDERERAAFYGDSLPLGLRLVE